VSVGLLAGAYPAFVLSRFQPAAVMKANQTSVAGGSGRLRKVLVFSQFLAAVALVASTAVIVHQAQFAASAQLGYDKRDKLVVKDISSDRVANAVRDELIAAVKRIPSVRSSAISDIVPTSPIGGNVLIDSPGDTGDQIMIIGVAHISHEFFSLYGIAAQAGRTFDLARGDDAEAPHMVINASAVRRIGFRSAEDAVGRTVRVHLSETLASEIQIVGVVPDVHFTSARFPVAPMVFLLDTTRARRLTIGFAPGSGPSVLRDVQATWAQIAPEVPFEADFLDALVDEQSRDERLLGIGLAGAGLLALIVAFAGLYGLSSFVTESRMREVAIRKVLGARDRDILGQLLWQTIQPILLACAVALPAAYFLMTRWLERFAYHIELGPGIFAVTGIAALTIAVATITGQTVGAARRRPVDTLRRD
jgi:putative ABC transport system permease protein